MNEGDRSGGGQIVEMCFSLGDEVRGGWMLVVGIRVGEWGKENRYLIGGSLCKLKKQLDLTISSSMYSRRCIPYTNK